MNGVKAPQKSSLDVSWRWQIWLVCTSNSGETSCSSLTQRPSDLFLSLLRVHNSTTILWHRYGDMECTLVVLMESLEFSWFVS